MKDYEHIIPGKLYQIYDHLTLWEDNNFKMILLSHNDIIFVKQIQTSVRRLSGPLLLLDVNCKFGEGTTLFMDTNSANYSTIKNMKLIS